MISPKCLRPLPLILALQAVFGTSAYAAGFTVASGTDTTGKTIASGTGTVSSGATLTTSGSTVAVTVNAGTVTIDNFGTISQTGTARAIDANKANTVLTINNALGATISAVGSQAIRIGNASTSFIINNQGTIAQTGVSVGGERAIKADANYTTTGNQIINGSATNTAAVISSTGNDALRIGSNVTLTNYGSIFSTGIVNTKCPDYLGTTLCPSSAASAADGVAIEDAMKNVVILNYGSITGPRHGIDGGAPVATAADADLIGIDQLVVTSTGPNGVTFDKIVNGVTTSGITIDNPVIINYAGGTITGNNGSGVGLDGHGVVINYGTISGKYAGAGNVYDHTGTGLTTSNGDGDGVDIDGVAYVENYGRIEGLGAGGYDSSGQPNGADGIAAGGGTIINHAGATIYGQSKGILIDDGSDGLAITAQRGTATATGAAATILNYGTIIGDTKVAIGLVGNFDDKIVNDSTGIIIGGTETTRLGENNSTVAGAAIQMGAGNDILTNYGYIEGKNGLAIDMGSGDDTLRLYGGTVVGTIDGGTGTNTLETQGTQTFQTGQISNFQNFHVRAGSTTFNYALGTVSSVQIDSGSLLRVNGNFGTTGDLTVNGTLAAATSSAFRTITVAGNYIQGTNGVLEARVGSNGESDKLTVTQTATLADGATIRAIASGYIADGTRYTLIDAGTLATTTGNLNLTVSANSNFLTYTLQNVDNDLILVAHRSQTLETLLPTSAISAAPAVQALLNNGSARSLALLNALEALSNVQTLSRATRQLIPETNGSSRQASVTAQSSVFTAFENRMDAARNGETGALDGSQTGMSSGDETRGRVWMQALAAVGKQKARNGADGYDVNAQGVAIGYETDLTARDLIGFSGGYTQAGTDGRDGSVGDDNNQKSFHIGAYFSRNETSYTLDASVALSANHNSTQRVVDIPGFSETLSGKFNGNQIGARFEYGLPFMLNPLWNGRWLFGTRLARINNGAYTESGGISAQSIGSANVNSVQSVIGAEFVNRLNDRSSITYRARYLHEFADTTAVSATFVNGGTTFIVDGTQPGRDTLQLGLGYRKVTQDGTSISIGYDLEARDKYLGHQLTAKAKWQF